MSKRTPPKPAVPTSKASTLVSIESKVKANVPKMQNPPPPPPPKKE